MIERRRRRREGEKRGWKTMRKERERGRPAAPANPPPFLLFFCFFSPEGALETREAPFLSLFSLSFSLPLPLFSFPVSCGPSPGVICCSSISCCSSSLMRGFTGVEVAISVGWLVGAGERRRRRGRKKKRAARSDEKLFALVSFFFLALFCTRKTQFFYFIVKERRRLAAPLFLFYCFALLACLF